MNPKTVIPVTIALVLLLFCAIVNGYWTDRWGTGSADELQNFSDRLANVPMSFGDWVGRDEESSEENDAQLKAAFGPSFTPLDRSGDVFSWDPS